MEWKELVAAAFEARKNSYAPYSNFMVGAALWTKNGKTYQGCNIENSSYSPTNCAERTAVFKAVSEGERDFAAIAICGGRDGAVMDFCYPCGVCRQVLAEFCNPETFVVLVAKSPDEFKEYRLGELLPHGFGSDHLAK